MSKTLPIFSVRRRRSGLSQPVAALLIAIVAIALVALVWAILSGYIGALGKREGLQITASSAFITTSGGGAAQTGLCISVSFKNIGSTQISNIVGTAYGPGGAQLGINLAGANQLDPGAEGSLYGCGAAGAVRKGDTIVVVVRGTTAAGAQVSVQTSIPVT